MSDKPVTTPGSDLDEKYKCCPFCGSGAVEFIHDFKKFVSCGNMRCSASHVVADPQEWNTRDV